jgi:putative sterol carrier protein
MPQRLDPEKAAGVDTSIQFDLSGDDGGQWYAVIKDGSVSFEEGTMKDPAATIHMSAEDFVAMTSGELNAVNAFMMGKVKVDGDLNTVMKFQSLFGM